MNTELMERRVRNFYVRWFRPHISREINRQRLKLVWDIWGYLPLLSIKSLSPSQKLRLLARFLIIDWNVVHGHKPREISIICGAVAERPAQNGEALLEAGCWQGGSSAKFSIICRMFGYHLSIYDSFCGVEEMEPEEKAGNYDFSGEYAAPESVLQENLARFGEKDLCSTHKGWFADTLAVVPVPYRVRIAYIDCDLAKGTKEALSGIVPALTNDGWIFSQDFHIKPVRNLLYDPGTWTRFGKGLPTITKLGQKLASIRFGQEETVESLNCPLTSDVKISNR